MTTTTDQQLPGVYPGFSPIDYHSRRLDRRNPLAGPISASELKLFAADPFAYPTARVQPSPALAWGSLVDCLLFTPDLVEESFAVSPFDNYRTKEAREWKAEQQDAGLDIVTIDQREDAELAVKALRDHHVAGEILADAEFQVALFTTVGADLPAKGLLDILPGVCSDYHDCIVDLKTTSVLLDDDSLARQSAKLGYHLSAAWYLDLYRKLEGGRTRFLHIWQRSVAPYQVRVTELAPEAIEQGLLTMRQHLDAFGRAAAHNFPNPYATGIGTIDLPGWQIIKEEAALN